MLNNNTQTIHLKIIFLTLILILFLSGCQENNQTKSLINDAKTVDRQLWDKYSQKKIAELLEKIDNNGFSEKALEQVALIFFSHGEINLSQKFLTLLSQKSLLPDYDYYLAQIAIKKEAYKQADKYIIAGLTKASDSDKVLFYLLRTEMMISLGEFDKAQKTLNRINQIQSNNVQSKYIQAQLYLLNNNCKKAIQSYKELIKLLPQYKQFNAPLASAYRQCGEYDLAKKHTIDHSNAQLQFPNHFTEKKQLLGNPVASLKVDIKALISQKRIAKATELLLKLIELEPDNDRSYLNLGSMYFRMNDLTRAQKAYSKSHELNPDNVKTSVNLGIVMLKQNRLDRAEYFFSNALNIQPLNVKATLNLASIKIRLNKAHEAELLLRKLLDQNIFNDKIRKAFIMSLSMQNKHLEALDKITQWINQDSNLQNIHQLLLQLLLQNFTLDNNKYKVIEEQLFAQLKLSPELAFNFILLKAKYNHITQNEALKLLKQFSTSWSKQLELKFIKQYNEIKETGFLGNEIFNES